MHNLETYSSMTKIGGITITLQQDKLSAIHFTHQTHSQPEPNPFAKSIWQALHNYFKDPHSPFNLPLHLNGTPFQKKVWTALQKIPCGKTITYGDLAKKLKTSARAIGNACRANPLPIIIPCHRVVAQSHLGGYAGQTEGAIFNIKIQLLKHEAGQKYDQRNNQHAKNSTTRDR